jgi:hypothetical protein
MVSDTYTRSRHRIWAGERRAKKLSMLREQMAASRAWISCLDLAKWVGRDNEIEPAPGRVRSVYSALREGLMAGEFEAGARSRVMCLHPTADGPWKRLKRQDVDLLPTEEDLFQLLPHCWIPAELAARWLRKRKIPLPAHLFPVSSDSSPGSAKASAPELQQQAAPRAVSSQALRDWYTDRVDGWPAEKRSPSEAGDWADARAAFPNHRVTRDVVREARRDLAPSAWKRHGPKETRAGK